MDKFAKLTFPRKRIITITAFKPFIKTPLYIKLNFQSYIDA